MPDGDICYSSLTYPYRKAVSALYEKKLSLADIVDLFLEAYKKDVKQAMNQTDIDKVLEELVSMLTENYQVFSENQGDYLLIDDMVEDVFIKYDNCPERSKELMRKAVDRVLRNVEHEIILDCQTFRKNMLFYFFESLRNTNLWGRLSAPALEKIGINASDIDVSDYSNVIEQVMGQHAFQWAEAIAKAGDNCRMHIERKKKVTPSLYENLL